MTTYFNPALGGLNCDIECGWMSLAPVTNEMYGYAAACPEELVGLDFTAVISHPAIGERACLDRGGDIGQILIYPGNLSTADKNQVGEYLSAYTGIAWTTIT